MFQKTNTYILLICLGQILTSNAQKLVTFESIPGRDSSVHYSCKVRIKNSNSWQKSFVLEIKSKKSVDSQNYNNGYISELENWTASWSSFEFANGELVEVEISKTDGKPIKKAMVRPVGATSAAVVRNGKVFVEFSKHANVNVDIDGQMEDQSTGQGYTGPPVHTISLFGNPIYPKPLGNGNRIKYLQPTDTIPTDGSWDTLCFLPGVHRILQFGKDSVTHPFYIRNYQVICIPGNAVVHGTFQAINTGPNGFQHKGDYWTIYGSGTISGEEIPHWRTGFRGSKYPFKGYATKIRLDGFVLAESAEHHLNITNKSDNPANVNYFNNIKTLAFRLNTDGGAMQTNTTTTNCFFRLQDDLLYCCHKQSKLRNCVFWTDAWGCMGVWATWFTNSPDSIPIDGLTFIYARRAWNAAATSGVKFRDARLGSKTEPFTIRNILVEDPFPSYGLFGFSMADPDTSNINPAPIFLGEGLKFENFVQPNHAFVPAAGKIMHNEMATGKNIGKNDTLYFSNINFKNFAYLQKLTTSFTEARFTGSAGSNVRFTNDCNNISDGGKLKKDQFIGLSVSADPIVGEQDLDPSGGILEYIWVKSTIDSLPSISSAEIIPKATDAIYYPGQLEKTTYFRRFVRKAGCSDYLGSSNSVKITIMNGGEIQTKQIALCPGTKPDLFENKLLPNRKEADRYIWVKSYKGCPVDTSEEIIYGNTASIIYNKALNETTYFRRFSISSDFIGFAGSNCLKIDIGNGLLAKYFDSILPTQNPKAVFVETPAFKYLTESNSIKEIMKLNSSSILWTGSVSTDSSSINMINHTIVGTSDINIDNKNFKNSGTAFANGKKTISISLTKNLWYPFSALYQRTTGQDHQFSLNIIGSKYCPNPICNNLTDGGVISGNQEICYGQNPISINNLKLPSGGTGELEYLWMKSSDSSSFIDSGEVVSWGRDSTIQINYSTKTIFYKRYTRRSGCTNFSVASNYVKIIPDSTKPQFTSIPENIEYKISGNDTTLFYAEPLVFDNCGKTALKRISGPASGEIIGVGLWEVKYAAQDSTGNLNFDSFNVRVMKKLKEDTSSLTFNVNLNKTGNFKVYPNPANNVIFVKNAHVDPRKVSITILNNLGQTVFSELAHDCNGKIPIYIDNLNSGIYFVEIVSNQKQHLSKLVILRE